MILLKMQLKLLMILCATRCAEEYYIHSPGHKKEYIYGGNGDDIIANAIEISHKLNIIMNEDVLL